MLVDSDEPSMLNPLNWISWFWEDINQLNDYVNQEPEAAKLNEMTRQLD